MSRRTQRFPSSGRWDVVYLVAPSLVADLGAGCVQRIGDRLVVIVIGFQHLLRGIESPVAFREGEGEVLFTSFGLLQCPKANEEFTLKEHLRNPYGTWDDEIPDGQGRSIDAVRSEMMDGVSRG